MATMTTTTAPPASLPKNEEPTVEPSKTLSRPALLTLSGLYQTSKSVYSNYMPETASKTVENLAEKLVEASTPYVRGIQRAVVTTPTTDKPAQAAPEGKVVDEPTSDDKALHMVDVDSFISQLCATADAQIDTLLQTKQARAVTTVIFDKVEAIKPTVETRVESVKGAVHDSQERIHALQERARTTYTSLTATSTECYQTVREYTPAARLVAARMFHNLRNEVSTRGTFESAKQGAGYVTDQLQHAVHVLREKGATTGAKELFSDVTSSITEMLYNAKLQLERENDNVASDTTATAEPEPEPESEPAEVVQEADLDVTEVYPAVKDDSFNADVSDKEEYDGAGDY